MSPADRSRTADSLTDFEFYPSSFGHSHQFGSTCDHPRNCVYMNHCAFESFAIF